MFFMIFRNIILKKSKSFPFTRKSCRAEFGVPKNAFEPIKTMVFSLFRLLLKWLHFGLHFDLILGAKSLLGALLGLSWLSLNTFYHMLSPNGPKMVPKVYQSSDFSVTFWTLGPVGPPKSLKRAKNTTNH